MVNKPHDGDGMLPDDNGGVDPQKQTKARHYTRGLSPLMLNIMAVNAMALLILVGGVLYLNQFRENLISGRIETLQVQAGIIAGALGESSAVNPDAVDIDLPQATQIITRMVGPTNLRVRLFNNDGELVADSQYLDGEKRIIAEELPALEAVVPVSQRFERVIYDMLDYMIPLPDAPDVVDKPNVTASDLPEVMSALEGEAAVQMRARRDKGYMINIAMPVQRFRRVLGGMMLTGDTDDIEEIVRLEQMSTVRIFAGALLVTILLSFFLGRTLARPIRVLARAAERVRGGIGREEHIPEFARRRDEIGDLSRSLSDMTRALYNQIDAVERFAADVSHELKNPLSSLRSAVETLQNSKDAKIRKRLFDVIEEDVKRLDRLISDISDASRLDAALTRGRMENVDLGVMLATLVEAYKTMRADSEVHVHIDDIEPGSYVVKGLDSRLGQVWNNLIDNAISFSPKGGQVTVDIIKRDKQAIVKVKDTGPGLPPGAEEKIFKRFYSERPDPAEFGSHSGLGLAISKQIIEAHGGRIVAENYYDDEDADDGDKAPLGACFTVQLPLADS